MRQRNNSISIINKTNFVFKYCHVPICWWIDNLCMFLPVVLLFLSLLRSFLNRENHLLYFLWLYRYFPPMRTPDYIYSILQFLFLKSVYHKSSRYILKIFHKWRFKNLAVIRYSCIHHRCGSLSIHDNYSNIFMLLLSVFARSFSHYRSNIHSRQEAQ